MLYFKSVPIRALKVVGMIGVTMSFVLSKENLDSLFFPVSTLSGENSPEARKVVNLPVVL